MRRSRSYRSVFAVLTLTLLAACVAESSDEPAELGGRAEALRIAGPWNPPASTRDVAATQYVPVVDPPAVSPLGRCTSSNAFDCSCTHPACTAALPGTAELDRFLRTRYPYLSSGGLYCCRQNSATTSVPVLSVHAIGRAIDLMVPMEAGDADNGLGDPVANWLVENAEFIGIQRVIWDRAYWNGGRGFGLLSSASLPHTNHIHVELSIDGAARRTAFFTSGASTGTCTARCDGTRLVRADCSTVECAATGAECLTGPARCGEPPPPEPAQAARNDGAALPSVAPIGEPARVTLLAPRRIFDTRRAEASAGLTRGGGGTSGPLSETGQNVFAAWSGLGMPAGTSGAWLNLTAIGGEGPTHLIVHPAGTTRPSTSNLNVSPGFVRGNAVPAVLGDGGGVVFWTLSAVHAIADLSAAFSASGAGLTTTGPRRVLDTRSDDAPLEAGVPRAVDVGAPAGATGVVATVAVIAGDAPGFLTAYPCGGPVPDTSNLNYSAGTVVANTVLSGLGADGTLCLNSLTDVQVIVDVSGYLSPDGPLEYQALTPRRLLDTRAEDGLYEGRLGARQTIRLPIQDLAGMPDDVWAVVANLTSTSQDGRGFLTAFPCDDVVPNTSALNFPSEPGAVGALTLMPVSSEGELCVFASGRTHLIVDVLGVWTHREEAPPDPDPGDPDPGDEGDDIPPEGGDGDPAPESAPDAGHADDLGAGDADAAVADDPVTRDRGGDTVLDGPASSDRGTDDDVGTTPDGAGFPDLSTGGDQGPRVDATPEGSLTVVEAEGCTCRTLAGSAAPGGHPAGRLVSVLGLLLGLVWLRRRSRAPLSRPAPPRAGAR